MQVVILTARGQILLRKGCQERNESGFYLLILGLIVLTIAVVLKAKEDITRRKARKNKPAAESVQG